MNVLRQKVLDNWKPIWNKFLKTDEPLSVMCNSEEDARKLRVMYYRAKLYCKELPELQAKYERVLMERQACVEGCAVIFRKHTKLYLEELLK